MKSLSFLLGWFLVIQSQQPLIIDRYLTKDQCKWALAEGGDSWSTACIPDANEARDHAN